MSPTLVIAIIAGMASLLILILALRLHAFLSLLIASIITGLLAGLPPIQVLNSVQEGMGNTLGFVAVVVGLGALLGAMLEYSGGSQALAKALLRRFGEKNASIAMVLTGFVVAIPVFFDVGLIILIYLVYALQKKSGKSLLYYALPLLAGLAATHAFVPPTPGPVAVAEILKADLGQVILIGICAAIPAVLVAGILFPRYISKRIMVQVPEIIEETSEDNAGNNQDLYAVLVVIMLPIILMIMSSVLPKSNSVFAEIINFLGHPFTALIIANIIAWYFLGIKRGAKKETLQKVAERSLLPAGIIILITGAGGVFKQVLIDTKVGEQLAEYIAQAEISYLLFAFASAAIVRILQGSSTVAMITAAALTAPLLHPGISEVTKALIVISISSGASIFSHINDSGFWLVNKYLGLSIPQTFKTWTALTTILGFVGFIAVIFIDLIL